MTKKIIGKITVVLTVFLILCCLYPHIKLLRIKTDSNFYVNAINKVNNWNFNGNSTGWSATSGVGTDVCGSTGTSADNSMASMGYNSNLGGQTAYGVVTANARNTAYRAIIYQTVTAPGSGSVKVKGNFSYYANSGYWNNTDTNWIRLDLYDSGNSTYVANLGCVSFNSNQSWTTTSLSSDATVVGGTTYTIRLSFRALTRDHPRFYDAITLGVDNITVNFAPTGLSASSVADSTNASLSWTASTAGTGANGLHATNPYKIYRDASSPVSTFLTNATTNSHTDSTTVGNTTYYFAVSDVDTASVESPLSAESSVLTRPGQPGTPTFTNIADTSLTVNWTAPTGGSPNYRIERAPDSGGSPGTWAEINTTSNTYYDDSGLSATSTYWYRIRGYNATGNGPYSGQSSQTTTQAVAVSITTNGSVDFGIIGLNSTRDTTSSDLNDPETISVDQGPADLDIKSTNFTQGINIWTLGSANGNNIVKFEFSKDGTNWNVFSSPSPTVYTFDTNVTDQDSRILYLKLTAPTSTDSYQQFSSTVTIMASAP